MKVAIIGGGWAGLAAAVSATQQQHEVTLYEMAPELGGRARSFQLPNGLVLDNGQHILIGAYTHTLKLLETVGVDIEQAFYRTPFSLQYPDGTGITFPKGKSPIWAFLQGLWLAKGWNIKDKFSLVRAAIKWQISGFQCSQTTTVEALSAGITKRIFDDLIEPLCISALNTQAEIASGQVFLKVLQDALFSQTGSSDFLIPRVPLQQLLPQSSQSWLEKHGVKIKKGLRITHIEKKGDTRWCIHDENFDGVIIATSYGEAKKLIHQIAPQCWTENNNGIKFDSIITSYLYSKQTRLKQPIMVLRSGKGQPAQFIIDLGAISHPLEHYFAMITSCSQTCMENMRMDEYEQAILKQASNQNAMHWKHKPHLVKSIQEKRATFISEPNRYVPPNQVAKNISIAGDYTSSDYPSTIEGAVRSGEEAVSKLHKEMPV